MAARMEDAMVGVAKQIAYAVSGITYVPHYAGGGRYVGPGYGIHNRIEYSEHELRQRGARAVVEHLWQRAGVRHD